LSSSFWLQSSSFSAILALTPNWLFLTLTFFSLFAILSSAFAFTLYLDFFDEVNTALSFQTILFSRFSALSCGAFRCEPLPFRRFINVSTLPRVVKRFGKKN
jgi:hypothetical protein